MVYFFDMNFIKEQFGDEVLKSKNDASFSRVDGYWEIEKSGEQNPVRCGVSDRNNKNMCFFQDGGTDVVQNRTLFFEQAGIDPQRTVMPDVVHGSDVTVISEDDLGKGVFNLQGALKVDGLISYIPNSTLAVDTGDCPVLLFSDKNGKISGLAHAGWKSLDGGIIRNILKKINERTPLDQIDVTLGVGICSACYRFPENSQHPLINNPNWQKYQTSHPDKTIGFDFNGYIKDQLEEFGIPTENITLNNGVCSCHSIDESGQNVFYSHRRASKEGADVSKKEGRFLTFIQLPKEESIGESSLPTQNLRKGIDDIVKLAA